MNRNLIVGLLALNLAITATLAGYLFTRKEPDPLKMEIPAPVVNVDLSALESPVVLLNENLDQLTSTILRFNTSLVQYDYLKGEMERLGTLDRDIGLRAQAALSQATDKNADETKAAVAKLKEYSGQIQTEQLAKRQTMLQLITGLERQLAILSNSTPSGPAYSEPAQAEPDSRPQPASPPPPATDPENTGNGAPSSPDPTP